MDARDLQQIDAFLTDLGQASLLEYYGVTADTPSDEVKARIKAKRSWAQAQQANPKFRFQALWLIKNNSLVQRVLTAEMKAYVEAVAARERDRKLQMLDLFVQGSLVSGKLSSESEAAIRRQASEMGLTESETTRYLEEKVGQDDQEDLFEPARPATAPPEAESVDYYELLRITPQATAEEVEDAYRERYRWARTLKDLQRANEIYLQLEQAWRILSDITRRRDYDDQRRKQSRAASAPQQAPQVPSALRATSTAASEPTPSPSGGAALDDDLEREPPSEIRLGRPQWAQEAQGSSAPVSPPPQSAQAPMPKQPALEPPSTPTPPPDFQSRTFQPGTPEAPAKPSHTPQLSVEGSDQISLGLLFKPVVRTITVRNTGKGRLRGNVASSQPWLQVTPRTLHLKQESQVVELRAFPGRLPGRSGRARVTISTTHGERWATNVDAYKRRIGRIFGGVITLLLLLLLVLYRHGCLGPQPEDPIHTILQIEVDPPGATIMLNDKMAGKGPEKLFFDPVQPGAPLELRVEHVDREPYVENMVFVDHQRIRRSVKLVSTGLGPSYAIDSDTERKLTSSNAAPAPPPAPPQPTPTLPPGEPQPIVDAPSTQVPTETSP